MQALNHHTQHISWIFNQLDNLYAVTSEREVRRLPLVLDKSFSPLISLFEKYDGIKYNVAYKNLKYERFKGSAGKNIIVCFSGGKDSTATALYYKNNGYNVTLFHLMGINKTYKDEWKNVERLADILKLPLRVETVTLIGNHKYVEHPLKNMIIANRALEWGIKSGTGTNIAFGNFKTSSLDNEPFDVCGGDCIEMWQAYESIIRTIIPKFTVHVPFNDFTDTLKQLVPNPEIAVACQSCIGPYRYRKYLHDSNVKKYGVNIPENRCGSCWKCCLEYCVYSEVGIYEKNEAFYNHCLQILKKTLDTETGRKNTLEEVEQHYFFYKKEIGEWVV